MSGSTSTIGDEIALDTNQAIAVLNNRGDTAQWLQSFTDIALPVIVIGELRFGALNSGKSKQNLERIERLVSRCRALDVTMATAEVYARLRAGLKAKGRPIPENDIWIAALCVEHAIPLATSDAHFDVVEELTVVKR